MTKKKPKGDKLLSIHFVKITIRQRHGRQDAVGKMKCPMCKVGTVKYMYERCRNRDTGPKSQGRCSSEGCIKWRDF